MKPPVRRRASQLKLDKLPSGSQWLHEIKHDGFRTITRKNGAQLRLYSRPGNELTHRFPLIVDAPCKLSPAITTASPRSISSGTVVLRTSH
jgi:ATP-dependent DNA ligase